MILKANDVTVIGYESRVGRFGNAYLLVYCKQGSSTSPQCFCDRNLDNAVKYENPGVFNMTLELSKAPSMQIVSIEKVEK